MNSYTEEGTRDVPIGFGLSLAMNEKAMARYSEMSESERKGWIAQAGRVQSKAEMERLVEKIGDTFR